jgi:hypothetical protein
MVWSGKSAAITFKKQEPVPAQPKRVSCIGVHQSSLGQKNIKIATGAYKML